MIIFNNEVVQEELNKYIENSELEIKKDSTFLITGATGYIGSHLVNYLINYNKINNLNVKIIVFVRNLEKAQSLFNNDVIYYIGDITDQINIKEKIDYIIHASDNTNSNYIRNYPVETLLTSVKGTNNLLEIANKNQVDSFIYLSSVEVYGENKTKKTLLEKQIKMGDISNPRNSYPIGKITSEHLTLNYFNEYDLNVKVVRLAQVIGPGFQTIDHRLFPYLGRLVRDKKEIVLDTYGETMKDYIYLFDAIEGILHILLKGENGNVYNLTNPNNLYSVYEIAEKFSSFNEGKVRVVLKDLDKYPKPSFLSLSTIKLEKTGYKSKTDIDYIIKTIINYLKSERN